MKWRTLFACGLLIAALAIVATPAAAQLSVVTAGSGINQTVTVESSGLFRLIFSATDNWGMSDYYDLVNDPTASTNLALANSVNFPVVPCSRENGIPQITFYGDNDKKESMYVAGCSFSGSARSITVLESTPAQVILQTVGHPIDSTPSIDTNITTTITYYIQPDGHIYINEKVGVVSAVNLDSDNFVLEVALNDPSGGSSTTTTSGWIRATDSGNPFSSTSPWANYAFAYWNTSDPSFPNFTKASILLVPGKSARNLWSTGGQILHGWCTGTCGNGFGTQRWGFRTGNGDTNFNLGAGGSLSWDWMIVLGTQNSTKMSNFTSSAVAGPIANAYINGPVITANAPTVNQGGTLQFTELEGEPGTWAVSGTDSTGAGTAGLGSIGSSTGTYTAPAVVNAQQSAGGVQLLPNNHIFNTRIDGLSVNTNSATWVAAMSNATFNILPAFPLNYVNSSTPQQSMVFNYTPLNNGLFQIPAYPDIKIECGWFSAQLYNPFNCDHHLLTVDTGTGMLQDMYQLYPAGTNTAQFNNCPLCTSQSGQRYPAYGYPLPSNGATDAGSLDLLPLILRFQEVEQACATSGTINHALRFTINAGAQANNTFIWPAMRGASGAGSIPLGARARLQAAFNISGFSPCAQIILTAIKNYGIINADTGITLQTIAEGTRWTKALMDVLKEINLAAIAKTNFEFVDESSREISASSGESTTNRETVCFTRTSDSAQACTDVVLVGVTLGLPNDQLNIQAGMPAQQLTAFVGGTANTGVTWTMSPTVGTLTSGGLYTPPATVTGPTTTTVTATSAANTNVAAQMTINVFSPLGNPAAIRIVPPQPSNYTDSNGNVWFAGTNTGSDGYGTPGTESCFSDDQGNVPAWPSTTDITLYRKHSNCFGDQTFAYVVPNGNYIVTLKTDEPKNDTAAGQTKQSFEVNGQVAFTAVDLFAVAGAQNTPVPDYVMPVTVTNNTLKFVVRHDIGSFEWMSALQIASSSSQPPATAVPTILSIRISQTWHAKAWNAVKSALAPGHIFSSLHLKGRL
jgi:hypothetical protein